jgi:adenosine kinase
MSALICGSVAYDNIMVFKDRFRDHILPDKVHVLSVSFLVPEMRKEFGGCAGNIAYNLKLLGGKPVPMATVGQDFAPYGDWMDKWGIPRRHVTIVEDAYTAQAFITTDLDDNQITAFHPGAMDFSHLNEVAAAEDIRIGIVAPDGREGMIAHASQFEEAGIPFIFDPSQGLPMFDGEDLKRFISQASYVTVNDYEWELITSRTGMSKAKVGRQVEALVITRGARGSEIHTGDRIIEIPPAKAARAADPTGCGDAYRAGLLFGITQDMDWETIGRIASLMGCIKVESHGTQNHRFEVTEFEDRFRECFGRSL